MPEPKRQFSCRPDDETWELIDALKAEVPKALGLVRLSDPEILRLAMIELRRKYPAEEKSKSKK